MPAAVPTLPISGFQRNSRAFIEPTALKLTAVSGPDEGKEWTIDQPTVRVGRSQSVHVQLRDATVSDFHVDLQGSRQSILVTDSGSSNGVFAGELQIESSWVPAGTVLRLGQTQLRIETLYTIRRLRSERAQFGDLLGQSEPMRQCYAELESAASCDEHVLLYGESGTGKDLAARAIHQHSKRRAKKFVAVNCGALRYGDASQAHGVLFGHRAGAFTGATSARPGAFREANGGVLFLNEVGDLPPEIQPILLDAIEKKEALPLGEDRPIKVDVRIVFATWHNLAKLVNEKRFRLDLYHRIAKLPIYIPSLTDRREDIPLLVESFVGKFNKELNRHYVASERTLALLCEQDYPGNVRELENLVFRLVFKDADEKAARNLIDRERELAKQASSGDAARITKPGTIQTWAETETECERGYIERLFRIASTHAEATKLADVHRTQLYRMIKRHELTSPWER